MDRELSRRLIERLERDARRIAAAFSLRYRVIEPEPPRVRRRLGVCYADGTIRIRLFHARTGAPLKYSSLVDTLCHELAHLRHFDHGRRFQAFYRKVLEFARREGIYRPGPAPEPNWLRTWAARARLTRAPTEVGPRYAPQPAAVSRRSSSTPQTSTRVPEQLALF